MKDVVSPSLDEINHVLKNVFKIDVKDNVVGFEILIRAADPDKYDRVRADYEAALVGRADEAEVRQRSYYGEKFAIFLESSYPRSEIADLSESSSVYYPICNKDEIRRIVNPMDAEDYLLRIRAREIAENSRLQRVFLRRRALAGANWSLSNHFDGTPFEEYRFSLPDDKRLECERVAAGFAFLREPNGSCIKSRVGDVIVVSETLREYLYYMNLFLMSQDESTQIPKRDSIYSFYIAIRTMMLSETPDFDLDPRGHPSEPIHSRCRSISYEQLQFVIGHEYSHYLKGHVGAKGIWQPHNSVLVGSSGANEAIYSRSHQQEFDADEGAMLDPEFSAKLMSIRLNAVTFFFHGLELWQTVRDYMSPPIPPSSHPSARDRLLKVRRAVLEKYDIDEEEIASDSVLQGNFEFLDSFKSYLVNKLLPTEIAALENYGSTYLDSFRAKVLHDRIDY